MSAFEIGPGPIARLVLTIVYRLPLNDLHEISKLGCNCVSSGLCYAPQRSSHQACSRDLKRQRDTNIVLPDRALATITF